MRRRASRRGRTITGRANPCADGLFRSVDRVIGHYGTPIRTGRDFDERDTESAPKVMLVNEAFALRFFPGRNLLGMPLALTFRSGSSGDISLGTRTVVGIAGDAAYRSIRTPMRPTIYTPLAQRDGPLLYTYFYVAVRSVSGPPTRLARSVGSALTAVNPDITMTFRPLTAVIDESLAQDRLVATLAGFFGALALLLAGLGLYGVTAYPVARRRTEIGIRMALGAAPSGVVRLVLSRVLFFVGVGVLVGITVSLWASQFVAALLYGLEPRDPATLFGATFMLAAAGGLVTGAPRVAHRSGRSAARRISRAHLRRRTPTRLDEALATSL